MIMIFLILGWVMWNGVAFFILKWLSEQYDKCCDMRASKMQFLAAVACLIAMSVIGITAALAVLSLAVKDSEL